MQETPVQFLGQEYLLEKGTGFPPQYSWASLVAKLVKNLPAMWETLVFWPGEFHGLYSPWDCKELDMTE